MKRMIVAVILSFMAIAVFSSCSPNDASSKNPSGKLTKANWYKVGNEWNYESTYFGKTRKRVHKIIETRDVDGVKCYVVETSEDGKAIQLNHYHVDEKGVANYLRIFPGKDTRLKFNPPQVTLSLPLTAGKSWEWKGKFNGMNDGTFNFNAETMEDVSVPAGKFKAFKVVMKGILEIGGGKKAETEMTQWYAQDVGLVKTEAFINFKGRKEKITSNLTSYKVVPNK